MLIFNLNQANQDDYFVTPYASGVTFISDDEHQDYANRINIKKKKINLFLTLYFDYVTITILRRI